MHSELSKMIVVFLFQPDLLTEVQNSALILFYVIIFGNYFINVDRGTNI